MCRHLSATASAESKGTEATSFAWHEATLSLTLMSPRGSRSLLTWAACRSGRIERLRLLLPILVKQVRLTTERWLLTLNVWFDTNGTIAITRHPDE